MSAVKFEIKSRFTGSVLFGLDADSLRLCVEAAVKARANLSSADLRGANLSGARISATDTPPAGWTAAPAGCPCCRVLRAQEVSAGSA